MKDSTVSRPFIALLYILTFILLREWLVLITEVTKTGYLSLFLLFVGGSFVLSLLKVRWPLSMILKLLYIVWAIQTIYLDGTKFSISTFSYIIQSIPSDVPFILTGEIAKVSNVSRTLVFFIFIWMLVYLIRYWIEVKQRILLFYFTTIILIATADTFSEYSAENSILMLMLVGLLLLGLLMVVRLNVKYEQSFSMRKFISIMLPLVFLLSTSSLFISFLPKLSPIWADPVPFLKAVVDNKIEENPAVSKSGYDPNDTQLGGPFIQDDSLIFEATVDRKQYWKVETKDTYTSKGWEQSGVDSLPREIALGEEVLSEGTAVQDLRSAQLSLAEEFPFIIHPYGLLSVDSAHEATIYYDRFMDKYKTEKNGKKFPLNAYHMTFNEASFSLKQLRETALDELVVNRELEKYLQLPDTLPERVSALAQSITESSESVYEKAKAIERYFSQDGFLYERTDVAIPTEGEDYVDQFLFDTKKGYCDNFSSSMVVMLRTLGIPARWVKGFAPGELTHSSEGEQVYRVSNNEAHSWVEAYMPEMGWVPFEPTIGFNGVSDIDYDIELSLDDPEIEEMPEEERNEFEKEQEKEAKQNTDEKRRFNLNDWIRHNDYIGVLLSGFLIGLGLLLYFTRRKWLPIFTIRRYRFTEGNWGSFTTQYHQLLKQLDRSGIKRASNETLSTYAKRVDEHFGVNHMRKLTFVYEQGVYGEVKEAQDWQQLQEIWEDLIKRTSD